VGTGSQLSQALLFEELGVKATDVPFDGGAPALTALLGNQVDVASLQIGEAIENIQAGKVTPLMVFGSERVEYLPDVPTAQELGFDIEVAQYRFMTVPKGTPESIRDRIIEGMKATFKTDAYQKFNEQNSLTPMEIPGDQVVAQLKEDKERYANLVEERGINLGDAS
jgi:tripartite-type tricarboxylate transporter receptor subunit TctC